MTVNELRHLLFDIDNQNAQVSIILDDGKTLGVSMLMVEPSDVTPSVVYLSAR